MMAKIKFNCLILFLQEILIIMGVNVIDPDFTNIFNEFIYKCYMSNEKLLDVIYDVNLLGDFISGNYEVLSYNQMVQLLQMIDSIDKYVELVDAVGYEMDSKVNQLALLFIEFFEERIRLCYEEDYFNGFVGNIRILQ